MVIHEKKLLFWDRHILQLYITMVLDFWTARLISETAAYFHLTEKYVEEIERWALKTLRDVMNDG
jgi:hypothetical protein